MILLNSLLHVLYTRYSPVYGYTSTSVSVREGETVSINIVVLKGIPGVQRTFAIEGGSSGAFQVSVGLCQFIFFTIYSSCTNFMSTHYITNPGLGDFSILRGRTVRLSQSSPSSETIILARRTEWLWRGTRHSSCNWSPRTLWRGTSLWQIHCL